MSRRKALNDVLTVFAKERYEKGETLSEIAEQLGVTAPTVRKAILSIGGETRKRGRTPVNMRQETLDEMKSLYQGGNVTLANLSDRFGPSVPTIRKILSTEGVTFKRGRKKGSKVTVKDILPELVGQYAVIKLTDLNPVEKPDRFGKLHENFYVDHAADNAITYIDPDKAILVYTKLNGEVSKTAMKKWRAEWRKSEDRAKVA